MDDFDGFHKNVFVLTSAEVKNNLISSSQNLMKNISSSFVHLHGRLQILENSITNKLNSTIEESSAFLQEMIQTFERSNHELNKFSSVLKSINKTNLNSISLFPFMKNLERFLYSLPALEIQQQPLDIEELFGVKMNFHPEVISKFISCDPKDISKVLSLKKEIKILLLDEQQSHISKADIDKKKIEQKENSVIKSKSDRISFKDFFFAATNNENSIEKYFQQFAFPGNQKIKCENLLEPSCDFIKSYVDSYFKNETKPKYQCDDSNPSDQSFIGFESLDSSETSQTSVKPKLFTQNPLLEGNYLYHRTIDTANREGDLAAVCKELEENLEDTASKLSTSSRKIEPSVIPSMHDEEEITVSSAEQGLQPFYIQRMVDKEKIESMSELAIEAAKVSTIPQNLSEDTNVLAQFSRDKSWYRAIILNRTEELYHVKFIDYGNEDYVPLSGLRKCPSNLELSKVSSFAYPCNLWGIAPINPTTGWSEDALNMFMELQESSNQTLILICDLGRQTREVKGLNPTLYVDMRCSFNLGNVSDELPVSIREAFLFREFGVTTIGEQNTQEDKEKGVFWKQNFNKPTITLNKKLPVIATRIDSPSLFYVQITSSLRHANKIMLEMQRFYASPLTQQNIIWKVLMPKPGMLCATRCSFENRWVRGRIEEIYPASRVRVAYVDTGIEEVLHYSKLRKIPNNFVANPAQAVPCKLANVTPISENGHWRRENIDAFSKQLRDCSGNVTATFHRRLEEVYEVSLSLHCINTEVDLALFMIENYIAAPDEENIEANSKVSKAIQNNYLNQTHDPFENYSKMSMKRVHSSRINSGGNHLTLNPHEAFALSASVKLESVCHFVDVLDITSPSLIHVRFLSRRRAFREFQDSLYKEMNLVRGTKYGFKPTVGITCAADFNDYSPFFARVKLLHHSKSFYKAHLIDCGGIMDINEENLHPLPKKFLQVKKFSMVVSLANIKPPCGNNKWPSSTTDNLKHIFSCNSDFYIIKMGPCYRNRDCFNLKVLPVEFGWSQEYGGGPFEANVKTYSSIRSNLLEDGLALPLREKSENVCSATSSSESLVSNVYQEGVHDDKEDDSTILEAASLDSTLKFNEDTCNTEYSLNLSENLVPSTSIQENCTKKVRKLPPQKSLSQNFNAHVTHVDMDGNICLHPFESKSTLTMMINAHEKAFEDEPCTDSDLSWGIGDYVVAKFHIDNKWYRARILNWNTNKAVYVEFIDYGNKEMVNIDNIRTSFLFETYQEQCYKCSLEIVPVNSKTLDMKWPIETLDFLHEMVVENNYNITVLKQKKGMVPKISMRKLEKDSPDICELLIKMGCKNENELFLQADSSEEELSPDVIVEINDELLFTLPSIVLPKDPMEMLVVKVVHVEEDPMICHVAPLKEVANPIFIGESFTQVKKAIYDLQELQTYMLTNGSEHKLSENPEDGAVYMLFEPIFVRVRVKSIHGCSAWVQFVDIGDEKLVAINLLYYIPAKYHKIPALAIRVTLNGIKPVKEKTDYVITRIKTCLIDAKDPIFASFEETHTQLPKVSLFFKDREGKKHLCYQQLLKEKVIEIH